MSIVSFVGLSAGGIFVSINSSRLRAEARAEVNSNLRFALDKMRQDLREATNVTSPVADTTSAPLVITVQGNAVTYALESGVITRNSVPVISNNVNVTALTFERFQNVNLPTLKVATTLRATITAEYNSTLGELQFTDTMNSTVQLQLFDYVGRGNGAIEGIQPPAP